MPEAVLSVAPEALLQRVHELQDRLESAGQSVSTVLAEELVSAVVQLYGLGLERIIGRLFADGNGGERIAVSLTEDPLLATLLLIHDLHPVPLEDRVQAALDSVRPYMESHGGNVELLSLQDGVARIHLKGSCSDCAASSVTLELAIKQALEEAAPDLEALEVEGILPQAAGEGLPRVQSGTTGMELPVVISNAASAPAAGPAWYEVEGGDALAEGALSCVTVEGRQLLIANVDGTLLAYRDACADCGGPLGGGVLNGGALSCPACQRSFFLPGAGRSMDDERMQLEPVPLLREQGGVRVALAA
ncbi:MAG: NifU family protein [Solirubrobacteraceae bacterium]